MAENSNPLGINATISSDTSGGSKFVQTVGQMKTKVDELKASIVEETQAVKEQKQAYQDQEQYIGSLREKSKQLATEIKSLEKELKGTMNLQKEKELAGLKRQLASVTAEINSESKALKDIKGDIKDGQESIKGLNKELKNTEKSLDKAEKAKKKAADGRLKGAINALPAPLKSAYTGISKLFTLLLKNPIALVITALGGLVNAFRSTAEGTAFFAGITGKIQGLVRGLEDEFSTLGGAIIKAFSHWDSSQSFFANLKNAINEIRDTLDDRTTRSRTFTVISPETEGGRTVERKVVLKADVSDDQAREILSLLQTGQPLKIDGEIDLTATVDGKEVEAGEALETLKSIYKPTRYYNTPGGMFGGTSYTVASGYSVSEESAPTRLEDSIQRGEAAEKARIQLAGQQRAWLKEEALLNERIEEAREKSRLTDVVASERYSAIADALDAINSKYSKRISLAQQELEIAKLRKHENATSADLQAIAEAEKKVIDLQSQQHREQTMFGQQQASLNKASKNAEEALGKEILNVRHKYESAEIAAMQDGSRKKLAEIDLTYQQQLESIEEWVKKEKKAAGSIINPAAKADALGRIEEGAQTQRNTAALTRETSKKNLYQDTVEQTKSYIAKQQKILDDYNELIRIANENGDTDAAAGLAAKVESEVQNLEPIVGAFFSSVLSLSKEDAQEVGQNLKDGLVKQFQNGVISANELAESMQRIDDIITSSETRMSKLTAWIEGGREGLAEWNMEQGNAKITEASVKLQEGRAKLAAGQELVNNGTSQSDINKGMLLIAEGENLVQAGNELQAAGKEQREAGSELMSTAKVLGNAASLLDEATNTITTTFDAISTIGEAYGMSDQSKYALSQATNVASTIGGVAMSALTGDWVGAIQGAISGVANIISTKAERDDEIRTEQIEEEAEAIENLEDAYDRLGDAVDKAYSSDKANLIKEQISNLEEQKQRVANQINEEKKKHNVDEDALDDYQQQLDDLDLQIKDLKDQAVDAIFGSDLQNAIESFADAYMEAWENGTSKATAAKDIVRSMIQSMVEEAIKADLSSPMEQIREKMAEYFGDSIIDASEAAALKKMATEAYSDIDEKYSWADRYISDTYEQEASSKGYTTISDETGTALEGRITELAVVEQNVYEQIMLMTPSIESIRVSQEAMSANLNEMKAVQWQSLNVLRGIEANTSYLSAISEEISKIRRKTDNI